MPATSLLALIADDRHISHLFLDPLIPLSKSEKKMTVFFSRQVNDSLTFLIPNSVYCTPSLSLSSFQIVYLK